VQEEDVCALCVDESLSMDEVPYALHQTRCILKFRAAMQNTESNHQSNSQKVHFKNEKKVLLIVFCCKNCKKIKQKGQSMLYLSLSTDTGMIQRNRVYLS